MRCWSRPRSTRSDRCASASPLTCSISPPAGSARAAAHSSGTGSCTWAEVTGPDGHTVSAELRLGEGVRATAACAAETTKRVLAGVKPGAWTAGQLFGAALVTDATGAQVTVNGQPA